MRFFRHLKGLLAALVGFAVLYKAWWIVPIVIILLLFALLIFGGQAGTPFIYTFF